MNASEQVFKFDIVFGTVECQSRLTPTPTGWIGEGRSIHRDRDGIVTKITPWEPTGCVMTWSEPERRPWWRFWR